MSQKLKTLKEKLRQAIRKELVEYDNLNTRKEKELEEASSTANIDGGEGPPKTPYAFQSKKQRAQDKKKEDEIATNSTGFVKMNENKLNEARGWKLLNNVLLKFSQHQTRRLALALKKKDEKCELYPLEVNYCDKCHNCQLSVAVDPKKMFSNYLYTSSTSKIFRDHFIKAANKYIKEFHNTQFIVKNTNKESLKILQSLFPFKPDKSVAITGTNGKTSVAWYLSQICKQANCKTKMLGTLGFYKNHKKVKDTFLTTPAFEDLYQFSHSKNKSTYNFIFEASSHALSQNRLRNIPVDIAAITNISNDHLDYHKNMSNYTKAKFLLFKKYLKNEGFAVINSNLKNLNELKQIIKKRKIKIIVYGAKDIFFEKKNKLNLNIYKKKYLIKNLNINNIEKQNIECAISIALLKINGSSFLHPKSSDVNIFLKR